MALETQSQARPAQRGPDAAHTRGLSPRGLALLAAALLLVLAWSFYMGFLVGRGQNPEEQLKKISEVWQGARPADPAAVQEAGSVPEGAAAEAPAVQEAQAPAEPKSSAVPGYPSFSTSQQTAAQDAPKVQERQPARETRAAQAKETRPAPAREEASRGGYAFVYRMATLRSQEAARSEQARYEAKGFRTSIQRMGSAWALLHSFTGTDADCEKFLSAVRKAGLGEPRRVSRKKR